MRIAITVLGWRLEWAISRDTATDIVDYRQTPGREKVEITVPRNGDAR